MREPETEPQQMAYEGEMEREESVYYPDGGDQSFDYYDALRSVGAWEAIEVRAVRSPIARRMLAERREGSS